MEDTLSSSHTNMDATLDIIAKEGCSSLLDEVFIDLEVELFFPQKYFIRKNNSGNVSILHWYSLHVGD